MNPFQTGRRGRVPFTERSQDSAGRDRRGGTPEHSPRFRPRMKLTFPADVFAR